MNPKEYLIVIDMQKDFINGSLANSDAANIIHNVVDEIKNWKGDVFYTKDTHGEDYQYTRESVLPAHCIAGTDGWQFEEHIQEALDAAHATCIEKPTFGYLGWASKLIPNIIETDLSTNPQIKLAELGKAHIGRIRIIGTCTDICVISNALILRAMFKETHIEVVANACAATSSEAQNAAIKILTMCDIKVI